MCLNSCLMTSSERNKLERQITKVKFIIASSEKINKRLGIRINCTYNKTLRVIKEVINNITGTKDYIMSKEEAYQLLEDIVEIIREESEQRRNYDILDQNTNISFKSIATVIGAPDDLIKSIYLASIHKIRNKNKAEVIQDYIVKEANKDNWNDLYAEYLIRRSNGKSRLAPLQTSINLSTDGGGSLLEIERKLSSILTRLLGSKCTEYTINLSHLCKFLDINRNLAQRLTVNYDKVLKEAYLTRVSLKQITTQDKNKFIDLLTEYKSIPRQARKARQLRKDELSILLVEFMIHLMKHLDILEAKNKYGILEKKLNIYKVSREWIYEMFSRYENKKKSYNKLIKELNINEK